MRKLIGILLLVLFTAMFISACGDDSSSGDGGANSAPIANAGQDKNVLTSSLVTLDGSGSSDADGDALTYRWSLVKTPAGSSAALSSSLVSKPTFTADTWGSYVLSLVVNDGQVSSAMDAVTVTAVDPRPVPDTGQITSYTTTTGEDSDYLITEPSYTDPGDGTITDNVTGLMWQKCSMGQITTSCTGTVDTYNWYQATGTADATHNPGGATNACGSLSLAGHDDWRLPTDFELMTIVNYETTPAINTTYFSPTPVFASHWSSTVAAGLFTYAWYVDFTVGGAHYGGVTGQNYVRCVRGGPSGSVFIDNGNGTVTDEGRSLMWQKQGEGAKMTWEQALAYCEGLELPSGVTDWRLPNITELASVVDYARYAPAINTNYFLGTPAMPSTFYWSSTTDTGSSNKAWCVDFYNGSVVFDTLSNDTLKTNSNYVRCVRSLP